MNDSNAVDLADKLREQGLQVTAQRIAVMEALAGNPHATAEDITETVRNKLGSISRQAVYDTLGVFVEKNLLRRIQPAGSVARYEDRVGTIITISFAEGDLMYDIIAPSARPVPHRRRRPWFPHRRGRGRPLGLVPRLSDLI